MKAKVSSLFPQVNKSIQRFLTEESGRITKKDALWIWVGIVLIAWVGDAVAGHGSSYPTSTNPVWADPFPSNSDVYSAPGRTLTNTWTIVNSATCNHASGIVNGHYSNVPSVNIASEQIDYTKTHSSHGSHGSGGWC